MSRNVTSVKSNDPGAHARAPSASASGRSRLSLPCRRRSAVPRSEYPAATAAPRRCRVAKSSLAPGVVCEEGEGVVKAD